MIFSNMDEDWYFVTFVIDNLFVNCQETIYEW
jgi:hypothetical protein